MRKIRRLLAVAVISAGIFAALPAVTAHAVIYEDTCEFYTGTNARICARLLANGTPAAISMGRVESTGNGPWRYEFVRLFRNGVIVREVTQFQFGSDDRYQTSGYNICNHPGDYRASAKIKFSSPGPDHEQVVSTGVWHLSC
jgi:hypothetical protein